MSRLTALLCLGLPLFLGVGLYPFWKLPSSEDLEIAETEVLKVITSATEKKLVAVGDGKHISTLIFKPPRDTTAYPVVLVHGFGGASLFFFKNIDALSKDRVVIAIDLPGFGLSSRFNFTPVAEEAETQFVDILEKWRVHMDLDRFILAGHSFGAFLVSCYALKYPSHVHHLVLLDPWGFVEGPSQETADEVVQTFPPGIRISVTVNKMFSFYPLSHIRASGPIGWFLLRLTRPDLIRIFGETTFNYLYHCIVQIPSGEIGYYHIQYLYAWAKNSLSKRIGLLHEPIGITMITGAKSWLNNTLTVKLIQQLRPKSYFAAHEIMDAGHHVYAETSEEFNALMASVCAGLDA